MARAHVGIGSNVEREKNLARAIDELTRRFGDLRQSGIYESEPVGFEGDPFFNAVIVLRCEESPRELVSILRTIEAKCGRRRGHPRLGPRTLDLDLLLYGDQVIHRDGLVIPRHEVAEHAFVLRPLADVAGGDRHPVTGETFAEMWSRFDDSGQLTRYVAANIGELSGMDATNRARRSQPAGSAQQGSA